MKKVVQLVVVYSYYNQVLKHLYLHISLHLSNKHKQIGLINIMQVCNILLKNGTLCLLFCYVAVHLPFYCSSLDLCPP
jgi:hypothetical protein